MQLKVGCASASGCTFAMRVLTSTAVVCAACGSRTALDLALDEATSLPGAAEARDGSAFTDAEAVDGSGSLFADGSSAVDGRPLINDDSAVAALSLAQPGHYTGPLTGTFSDFVSFQGGRVPITATVSFDLGQSTGGQGQVILNGSVVGTAGGVIALSCTVTGKVGGSPLGVEPGASIACTYCSGISNNPPCGAILGGSYSGPFRGPYDATTHAFVDGTWDGTVFLNGSPAGVENSGCNMDAATSYHGCGTWSAKVAP
jgi:hypothetical protein